MPRLVPTRQSSCPTPRCSILTSIGNARVCGSGTSPVGRVRFEREALRAQSAHDDAAGQERGRIPRERDIVRARVGVGSAPRDAPDAHGVEQRARGAVDLERAAAPRDELAQDEVEAGLPREKDVARDDERGQQRDGGDERAQRAIGATPAPVRRRAVSRVLQAWLDVGHRLRT